MPVKPCLGFASRTDAAEALAARGLSSEQIADELERATGDVITPKTVDSLLASRHRTNVARLANLRAQLLRAAAADRKATLRWLSDVVAEIQRRRDA